MLPDRRHSRSARLRTHRTVTILAALVFIAMSCTSEPERRDAANRLMTAEPEWLEWRFLGNLSDSIAANRRKLSTKSRLLSSALSTLIAGAVVLGGYLVVHTITAGA